MSKRAQTRVLLAGVLSFLAPLPAVAVDRVLVPRELGGAEAVADIRRALDHVAEERHREAVELLQRVLIAGLEAGSSVTLGGVVRAPAEIPADLEKFEEALEALYSGDEEDEGGGASGEEASRGEEAASSQWGQRVNIVKDPRTGRMRIVHMPVAATAPAAPGRRFLPVSRVVEAAFSVLPPESIRSYREQFDPVARELLEEGKESHRVEPVRRVAREFFFSSVGDEAAETLGDLHFEQGDYEGALQWWRKILREYPGAERAPARVHEKILYALRILGREREYDFEKAAVAGVEDGTSDLEASVPLVAWRDRPLPPRISRWGGELPRGRPPVLPASAFRLSWDSWLWSREGLESGYLERASTPLMARGSRVGWGLPSHYPFVPLLVDDVLYLSGVFSLYKLDARPGGGSLLKEYRKPLGADCVGYVEDSDSALYTTTIWKREVEAAPGLEDLPREVLVTQYIEDQVRPFHYMNYAVTGKIPIRGLVAFDAGSGQILWKTGTAEPAPPSGAARPREATRPAAAGDEVDPWEDLELPRDPELLEERILHRMQSILGKLGVDRTAALKDFSYNSPVIIKGGLVVGGGWVQRGYVSSALRALDLKTGRLVWETPIVNSGMVERTLFGELAREPFAGSLIEEGGVLYYLTQLGAVAAVELETGKLLWLSTYDTIPVPTTHTQIPVERETFWGANPLLLIGPVLVATPRDSAFLYAFDTGKGPEGRAGAGRILWRFANQPEATGSLAGLRDLLGCYQGRLYLSGAAEIVYLDLAGMDAAGHLVRGGKILDTPKKVSLSPTTLLHVQGPGVLTTSGIMFSDFQNLLLMTLDPPRLRPLTREPFRESEWGSYPGRVLLSDGMVVVTSRTLLSAYGPLEARLDAPRVEE